LIFMQTGEEKRAMRTRALARRASAFAAHGAAAGARLAAHGLSFLALAPGSTISGFAAIRDEIDPLALLLRLHGEGHGLGLPVMQGKGLPLVFRAWAPGDAMGEATWGIAEPLPDKPVLDPDVVLVPLLAFDDAGYRLGYGGGFYDRTLARLRAIKPVVAVGIAYDELKVDAVPHQSYDERLDWVLTPSGPLQCLRP
jgi:5-formyltetrahydrofolate cyclo-ligase